MSEFKFACPVCGQHLTADASASGTQLECPTCFRKIVVPQAPASTESKFILAASQVSKPRPTPLDTQAGPAPGPHRAGSKLPVAAIALAVLVLALGAAGFVFKDKIFKPHQEQTSKDRRAPSKPGTQAGAGAAAADGRWTLDLANAAIPETPATGLLHGSRFACERATLEGGTLALRQGKGWPPPLGLTVVFPAGPGEPFSGKTFEGGPGSAPPASHLVLRWLDEQQQPAKQEFKSGYALKVAFGPAANGRIPGKLYVCLPDEKKSFIAGTFDAELRQPKPKTPGKKRP